MGGGGGSSSRRYVADHFADFFLIPQDSGLACCYSVQVVRHGLVKLKGGGGGVWGGAHHLSGVLIKTQKGGLI